jgi:hypothetical protein
MMASPSRSAPSVCQSDLCNVHGYAERITTIFTLTHDFVGMTFDKTDWRASIYFDGFLKFRCVVSMRRELNCSSMISVSTNEISLRKLFFWRS